MSGKLFVAVVAAAVSSASAATVGIVYKNIVEPKPIEASVSVSETAASAGPVRSAVVLNASDSFFGFFAGSAGEGDSFADSAGASDPTACRGRAGCVVVARASDRRVDILGSAATIPPVWLGGDSRDAYADRTGPAMLSAFNEPAKITIPLGRLRRKTRTLGFESQSDDGSAESGIENPSVSAHQNASGASGSGASSATSSSPGVGYPIEIELQTSPPLGAQPSVDGVSWPVGLLNAYSPIDAAPNATPGIGLPARRDVADRPPRSDDADSISDLPDRPATPEPSTWSMTIAGLATLACSTASRRGAQDHARLRRRPHGTTKVALPWPISAAGIAPGSSTENTTIGMPLSRHRAKAAVSIT